MQNGRQVSENKILSIILIILILIIAGLSTSLIILNSQKSGTTQVNLIDTSEKMAGWGGSVADSTRALILTETIQDKLSSDPDYNPPQAIAEYQSTYDAATGDLKLYIAIEYANYLNNSLADINQAIAVLQNVKYTEGTTAEIDYLRAMYDLYVQAKDTQKAEIYHQMILEKTPDTKNAYSAEGGE